MATHHNLPTTFERRGTTVPLAHPGFGRACVRDYDFGKDRVLEAVLSNYSGVSCGQLTVIPWRDLRDQTTFSERDLIHNPKEDTRQLARDQMANNRFEHESVQMSCLAQLTRKCCISRGDAFMAKANTKIRLILGNDTQQSAGFDIRMLIKRVMQFAAKRGGTSVEDVRNWMDSLVGLIAPFGV
jgi:hypothetical protein